MDALDERTEDNRADCDLVLEKIKSLEDASTKFSADNLRREVDARIIIKEAFQKKCYCY